MNCTASDLGRERSPEAMWHAYRDASVPRRVRKNVVTTTYAYDDLNRLLSASSTGAVSGDTLKTYTYNAIGNIASSTDLGAYSYAGTGYANPDAVTQVLLTTGNSAPTIAYDNSGIGGNGTPASSLTF